MTNRPSYSLSEYVSPKLEPWRTAWISGRYDVDSEEFPTVYKLRFCSESTNDASGKYRGYHAKEGMYYAEELQPSEPPTHNPMWVTDYSSYEGESAPIPTKLHLEGIDD